MTGACSTPATLSSVQKKNSFGSERKWEWWVVDGREVWEPCLDERLFETLRILAKICFISFTSCRSLVELDSASGSSLMMSMVEAEVANKPEKR